MEKAPQTAKEVVDRLKDDGDFDTLRVKIIRKVKENEELRHSIAMEVKESILLNDEGTENMKPRELSDGIYKEIGSRIMGQISDALWKVIRSDEGMKTEIRETVELVYNRMINAGKQKSPPPPQQQGSKLKTDQDSHKDNNTPPSATSLSETTAANAIEPMELLGFNSSNQPKCSNGSKEKLVVDATEAANDELPPGFAPPPQLGSPVVPSRSVDEDPDVPPGFGW